MSLEEGRTCGRHTALELECLPWAGPGAASAQPYFHASCFWLLPRPLHVISAPWRREGSKLMLGRGKFKGKILGEENLQGRELEPGARQTSVQAAKAQAEAGTVAPPPNPCDCNQPESGCSTHSVEQAKPCNL